MWRLTFRRLQQEWVMTSSLQYGYAEILRTQLRLVLCWLALYGWCACFARHWTHPSQRTAIMNTSSHFRQMNVRFSWEKRNYFVYCNLFCESKMNLEKFNLFHHFLAKQNSFKSRESEKKYRLIQSSFEMLQSTQLSKPAIKFITMKHQMSNKSLQKNIQIQANKEKNAAFLST